MKLLATRRTDLALSAMVVLAEGRGASVKAEAIGAATGMSRGMARNLLQRLERAHLVVSRTSRRGGYRLAAPPARISVRDIVEALEGPVVAPVCSLEGLACRWIAVCPRGDGAAAAACPLDELWARTRLAVADQLAGTTLADLTTGDRAAPGPR